MLLEMHSHTSKHSSCSVIDPVTLVQRAVTKGFQGLIITEHGYLWSEEEINELRGKAEVNDNFLILAGQEAQTDMGHVLVYGADESIAGEIKLQDLRTKYPKAALVWAHPFRNGKLPAEQDLMREELDGIEIFSSNQNITENYRGLKSWHKLKFTAICGSDTHSVDKTALFPTQFDHPVKTISDVADEITRGRCRPFFKEIPKSGSKETVTEITIGTKGYDDARERIIIRNIKGKSQWPKKKKAVEMMQKLAGKGFGEGSFFRVPRILDVDEKSGMIIEEGQRGKDLFTVISRVSRQTGIKYIEMAAAWLARMHNIGPASGKSEDTRDKELKRFDNYKRSFVETGNPCKDGALKLIEAVRSEEERLFEEEEKNFVDLHGDFHPKNIIIGQDNAQDPHTSFVSIIDFDSSFAFLPEYDIGYFLAQFRSQFSGNHDVVDRYPESVFINAYSRESKRPWNKRYLSLFKARANLSIASYLIKVGKGTSGQLEAVMKQSGDLIRTVSP